MSRAQVMLLVPPTSPRLLSCLLEACNKREPQELLQLAAGPVSMLGPPVLPACQAMADQKVHNEPSSGDTPGTREWHSLVA